MADESMSLRDRNEIFMHIGRLVTYGTEIDRLVGVAVARLINPLEPRRVLPLMVKRTSSDKINLLKTMISEVLVDGDALIVFLRSTTEYRNSLAHSRLSRPEYLRTLESNEWGLEREEGGPILLEELESEELTAEVLLVALIALLTHMGSMPVEQTSMSTVLTSYWKENPTSSLNADERRAREGAMFPAPEAFPNA
jgi:hypothetical protein